MGFKTKKDKIHDGQHDLQDEHGHEAVCSYAVATAGGLGVAQYLMDTQDSSPRGPVKTIPGFGECQSVEAVRMKPFPDPARVPYEMFLLPKLDTCNPGDRPPPLLGRKAPPLHIDGGSARTPLPELLGQPPAVRRRGKRRRTY